MAKNSPKSAAQLGFWQCVFNIVKLLVTSGYGAGVLLVIALIGTSYALFGGMDSADKKAVLMSFIGWPVVGLFGWAAAGVTILIARKLLKAQQSGYERQINNLRNSRDQALLIQQKLNLTDKED